jgi:hypothetical protein
MLQKNNRPPPKKKAQDAAEFDAQREALLQLLRDYKKAWWEKNQTTFLSKFLMTPEQSEAYREDCAIELKRLFQKYKVDPDGENAWCDLALALARRYEPDFSSRSGRPKERQDDPELILMIQLLQCRHDLSIPKACETIAEKGVIKGKPGARTLQNRYKELKRHDHWKAFIQGFELAKAKVGMGKYIKVLEEAVGGIIN